MSTSPSGQPTLGRYDLVREIARSNDVVWEGRDPQMNRRVAVKELSLPPNLSGQARRDRIDRFYREARAAGAMAHANIVTIHEVGEDCGRYFIAMEYLEGQTLRERLTLGGPMPLSEVASITIGLCDALEYAHARGVIHRDIKPDNIHLLPGGRVKLTDFGIARITSEEQLTVAGQVFGTPSYMSPEQILGRPIDARSDEFSLAIVVFEMIAGAKPFTGDSVATITYRIVNEATPQVTGAPTAVDTVLHRALAKDSAGRYLSIGEFRTAFAAAAQTRTGSQNALNAAVQPFQNAPVYAAPMQEPQAATAHYGAQTQVGVAPGYAAGPVPVTVGPTSNGPVYSAPTGLGWQEPPQPAREQQKTVIAVLISLVLVAGAALGGGWAVSHAFQNFSGESAKLHIGETYGKAVQLYKFGDFSGAATAFKQVRLSPQASDTQRTQAEQGELFCYRQLGHVAQNKNDLPGAASWYQAALTVSPNDAQARTELDAVQKLQGAAAASQANPQAGATLDGAVPIPSPPGGSSAPQRNITTNDFTNANAQNDARARPYLDAGKQAESQGRFDEAQDDYRKAMGAGPGSAAATEAGNLLQQSLAGHSDSSLIGNGNGN